EAQIIGDFNRVHAEFGAPQIHFEGRIVDVAAAAGTCAWAVRQRLCKFLLLVRQLIWRDRRGNGVFRPPPKGWGRQGGPPTSSSLHVTGLPPVRAEERRVVVISRCHIITSRVRSAMSRSEVQFFPNLRSFRSICRTRLDALLGAALEFSEEWGMLMRRVLLIA